MTGWTGQERNNRFQQQNRISTSHFYLRFHLTRPFKNSGPNSALKFLLCNHFNLGCMGTSDSVISDPFLMGRYSHQNKHLEDVSTEKLRTEWEWRLSIWERPTQIIVKAYWWGTVRKDNGDSSAAVHRSASTRTHFMSTAFANLIPGGNPVPLSNQTYVLFHSVIYRLFNSSV